MSGMLSWANFLWMLPPDSSAARMPLGLKTRFLAISSMFSGADDGGVRRLSSSRVREALSLECSRLVRARRKLSSTDLPRMKLPRIVAAAIE